MRHPICTTKDNRTVYTDLIHSKAAGRIAQQPYLLGLAQEVLPTMTLRDAHVKIQHDMRRLIGYDFVINTTTADTIFYAQPAGDDVYCRYIKDGKPSPAQHLVLQLQRDGEGYELTDLWIGHISPPRPGSADEAPESRDYWSTHAFISDNKRIRLATCTKTCPY